MTIHKSKGLEYHTVIFVGLDDGAWWSFAKDQVEATAVKHVERLLAQGNRMLPSVFRSRGRKRPGLPGQVDFLPRHVENFRSPRAGKRQKPDARAIGAKRVGRLPDGRELGVVPALPGLLDGWRPHGSG